MRNKPLIMQQVVAPKNIGGTSTEYKKLINSTLKIYYDFIPLEQEIIKGLDIKEIIRVTKIIKEKKPDIIHIRGAAIDGLNTIIAAKLARNCKILLSVHGMYSDLYEISNIKKFISYYIIEPLSFRLSDGVYCVCKYATERAKVKRHNSNLLGYVYNTIPKYDVSTKNELRSRIRQKLYISNNSIIGIYVGRITYDKGMSYLSEALLNMEKNWPNDFKMIIIGEGNYENKMRGLLSNLILSNKVIFLGKKINIKDYLFASDFFISPTLHENHSIALLEALAAELPIITTSVGGNPEVVYNGINGCLINKQNIIELEQAIRKFICNKHDLKKMGLMGKELGEKLFNENDALAKLDVIYKSLLDSN